MKKCRIGYFMKTNPIQTQSKPIQSQFKPKQTQPVVSLPALSLPVLSIVEGSKGSNLFQRQNMEQSSSNDNSSRQGRRPRVNSNIIIRNSKQKRGLPRELNRCGNQLKNRNKFGRLITLEVLTGPFNQNEPFLCLATNYHWLSRILRHKTSL